MYHTVKRFGDIALAIVLLLPCLILCVFITFVLKQEVHSTPLFIQKRIGFNGRVFKLYKLRTMRPLLDNELLIPF